MGLRFQLGPNTGVAEKNIPIPERSLTATIGPMLADIKIEYS